jgi:uncharacterized protein YuzE
MSPLGSTGIQSYRPVRSRDFRLSRHGEWGDDTPEYPAGAGSVTDRAVLEDQMKLVYDPEVDVLSVVLSEGPVAESDEDKPGVILDYDDRGNRMSFEILDASKRMANPMSVEYAVTPPLRRPA